VAAATIALPQQIALTHTADRRNGRAEQLVFVRVDDSIDADAPSAVVGALQHHGHDHRLQSGLVTCARTDVPLRLQTTRPARVTIAAITTEAIVAREPQALSLAGHAVGGLVRALIDELAESSAADACIDEDVWLDRLALALTAEVGKLPGGSLATGDLFAQADRLLRDRSVEPNLRVVDIAEELGVRVQSLEQVFRQRRTSVLEYLMTIRVEAARAAAPTATADTGGAPTLTADDLDLLAGQTGFFDGAHLRRCWSKVDGRTLASV